MQNVPHTIFRVLLIGCDAYPAPSPGLRGCVNDIDAMERLLLDLPGEGVATERIRITRLAAPHPGASSTSQLQAATRLPTRANIIDALQELAVPGDEVVERVLIYYSGHGEQARPSGGLTYHEAIVPIDLLPIYDVEMNALIGAIGANTPDLTVVLDSCHSGGATRDLGGGAPLGNDRVFKRANATGPPFDSSLSQLASSEWKRRSAAGMLQGLDPAYLVVAACQPYETAAEALTADGQVRGILSNSLATLIGATAPTRRAELRWADVWPELLETVEQRCSLLHRRAQHPWLIGRPERRVFGGPWEPGDTGYGVRHNPDGTYLIGAGSLLGLTPGARVAVYGVTPRLFPRLDSDVDVQARFGTLVVREASRATSTASADGPEFDLPEGARARLVVPGPVERLRVFFNAVDPHAVEEVTRSSLLGAVEPGDADVLVSPSARGGWTISSDVEAELASVPPGATLALRAGLESFNRQVSVLRLAQRCADPQLARCLDIMLLDCSDAMRLASVDPGDPLLPEAARDVGGIYHLAAGFAFCVRLGNLYPLPLNVALLNCSAGGAVEYMGRVSLNGGDRQTVWRADQLRRPFEAWPDYPRRGSIDRLVAVATTRADVDLRSLEVRELVQEVVDRTLDEGQPRNRSMLRSEVPAGPAELWTATVQMVRIDPADGRGTPRG